MTKRIGVLALVAATLTMSFSLVAVQSASAVPPFKKEFDNLYLKKDSTSPADQALVVAVEKVKCNVCHKGKNKKLRNAYGDELAKLLDKKTDAKDPEKIKQALEKVAALPSDANNASSPTFGDLIKEGKLPGGEAEEEEAAGE
jgi:hypothetical protein